MIMNIKQQDNHNDETDLREVFFILWGGKII